MITKILNCFSLNRETMDRITLRSKELDMNKSNYLQWLVSEDVDRNV